jgi:hypothetical protein
MRRRSSKLLFSNSACVVFRPSATARERSLSKAVIAGAVDNAVGDKKSPSQYNHDNHAPRAPVVTTSDGLGDLIRELTVSQALTCLMLRPRRIKRRLGFSPYRSGAMT